MEEYENHSGDKRFESQYIPSSDTPGRKSKLIT